MKIFTYFRDEFIRDKGDIEVTSSSDGPKGLVSLDGPDGTVKLDIEGGTGACIRFNIYNKGTTTVTLLACELLKYQRIFHVDDICPVKIFPGKHKHNTVKILQLGVY